jgi:hypothetical protein
MNHQGKWQSYASLSVIAAVAIAGGALAIIEARAAPPAETASEPAEETEVTVSFDTDPVKTGYEANDDGTCKEPLQRHVYATVSPASARDDITFTIAQEQDDERVELSEPEEFDDDQWEFDVGGLSATPSNKEDGDTTIQAIYKGKVVGQVQAIVQVPDKIGKPHDQPSGTVPFTNFGMNLGTSPAGFEIIDPNKVRLITYYVQWLTIAVVDQFGQPLEDAYAGQSVFEIGGDNDWHTINQALDNDGTYQDPVGVNANMVANGQFADVAKDGTEHTAWKNMQEFDVNGVTILANSRVALETREYDPVSVTVRIAGHVLSEGVVDRRTVATYPDTIEIVWPDD